MSKYWDNNVVYSQPTMEELRNRVKASTANAAKKKLTYDPIKPFSRRNICTSWWGRHGAATSSNTPIMPRDLTAGNAM